MLIFVATASLAEAVGATAIEHVLASVLRSALFAALLEFQIEVEI